MPAQVRQNQAVARLERWNYRQPELMMGRKWMKKNNIGTAALNFVEDFGIVRAQAVHVKKLEHRHDFIAVQLHLSRRLGIPRFSRVCTIEQTWVRYTTYPLQILLETLSGGALAALYLSPPTRLFFQTDIQIETGSLPDFADPAVAK
jgi:hypothetical protein